MPPTGRPRPRTSNRRTGRPAPSAPSVTQSLLGIPDHELNGIIRSLKPNESLLSVLAAQSPNELQAYIDSLTPEEAVAFEYNWDLQKRPMQVAPDGEWDTWVLQGGRGVGKTRPGSEQVIRWAQELGKDYGSGKIALIAKDPGDARDVMIEGESGILACSPPYFRPKYEPSKRRLTWDNGVTATIFSSEVPDDLRGPQHHKGWGDEICKWKHPDKTWEQYQFGLRLGRHPQTVLTTTPRPIRVFIDILKDPGTRVSRGKTDDNFANLSPRFIEQIYRKYQGTRLGRQELDAELLSDTPGALWTLEQLDELRVDRVPCDLVYVVIGIDPGLSDPDFNDPLLTDTKAETGIVVVGRGEDKHCYVMHDFSGHLSANEWGQKAVTHGVSLGANMLVGETNNGGDLVEFVIRAAAEKLGMLYAFEKVTASRGKRTRAEPVSALAEQKRFHMVGTHAELEDQMTTWVPGMKSPDRMDAMVWAATRAMIMYEQEEFDALDGKAVW